MRVLVVGADRLGNIAQNLHAGGVKEIIHWTGRSKSYWNKAVPQNVEKVIVFYDFIDHNTVHNVKRQAKLTGIPIFYSKRALSQKASWV